MRKTKTSATRWLAILLLVAHLFSLTACGNKQADAEGTSTPTGSVMPTETEGHTHEFVDGLCECGASNGLEDVQIIVDSGLNALERKDSETGMTLISNNGAGDPAQIRLDKEIEAAHGHFYEMVYRFTSNVAGSVRFACEGATIYEEDITASPTAVWNWVAWAPLSWSLPTIPSRKSKSPSRSITDLKAIRLGLKAP